jgi:UDP-glucose 4-epimerase
MKVLITGGAGFIGSHLVERLTEEGYEVVALDNLHSGSSRLPILKAAGVELIEADIRDPLAAEAMKNISPDVVFNLAAQIDVRVSVEDPAFDADVNVVGFLRLLESAASVGARFIHTASGGAMFGELTDGVEAITEQDSSRPISPYGISKRIAEDYLNFYARERGVDFVNLAPGNVYGPRQDPHGEAGVVAIFAGRLIADQPCNIYGDGKQSRDYVYVEDLVDAFVKALTEGTNETINIATGIETSVMELYSLIAEATGSKLQPDHLPERPGDAMRVKLDITKARQVLSWEPKIGLEEGIRRTVESVRLSAA